MNGLPPLATFLEAVYGLVPGSVAMLLRHQPRCQRGRPRTGRCAGVTGEDRRMGFDSPLRCRCGHVRGAAREVSPSTGFRFVCYCTDCQAFAHMLGRSDVLDAAGGTDIFHLPAGRVTLTAGTDAVCCLSFSGKVLRWYADCC